MEIFGAMRADVATKNAIVISDLSLSLSLSFLLLFYVYIPFSFVSLSTF